MGAGNRSGDTETGLLALNVGSGSVKFAGYTCDGTQTTPILSGSFDASVDERATYRRADGEERALAVQDPRDRAGLIDAIVDLARDALPQPMIAGHRVLHGGGKWSRPVRLTPDIVADLERLSPLAPLHQSAGLEPVRRIFATSTDLDQVAVFDCGFHETMPALARTLPLPLDLREKGYRKYGFHGLSYEQVADRMAVLAPNARRVVAVHLGGGASLCALLDGESVETTMGATPLDGPMMSTRSGGIDPGLVLALARSTDIDTVEALLWNEAGLKGVSGISGDLRHLLSSDAAEARLAVDLFCRDLVRHVGSLAAILEGLDALVFTGGAGAAQQVVRARVCAALGWLGVGLDADANEAALGQEEARISALDSTVEAWVIPTDEEAVIARKLLPFVTAPAHA